MKSLVAFQLFLGLVFFGLLVTQLVVPLFTNTKFFPMFRKARKDAFEDLVERNEERVVRDIKNSKKRKW